MKTKSWEKEFDNSVGSVAGWSLVNEPDSYDDAANQGYDVACKKAKSFISTLLSKQKQEIIRIAEGMKVDKKRLEKLEKGAFIGLNDPKREAFLYKLYYESALFDLIEKLKEMEDGRNP